MDSTSKINFVRQQGFHDASSGSCGPQYEALMWQPRAIGVIMLVGIILQPWPLFLALSAVLWWNVLLPHLNPFDVLYNAVAARAGKRPRLAPAPPPRRFAQAVAASFGLGIGVALLAGVPILAYALEAFLAAAVAALVFGRFCLGSYLWHLMVGQSSYANRTLPWSKET